MQLNVEEKRWTIAIVKIMAGQIGESSAYADNLFPREAAAQYTASQAQEKEMEAIRDEAMTRVGSSSEMEMLLPSVWTTNWCEEE